MKRIKVVLAEMPPLLRDIVRDAVASQPDMDIVAEAGEWAELPGARGGADVVIIGARRPDDSGTASRVFGASTRELVLAIALDGRSAAMWQLQPHKVSLGEVSAASLVAAIRARVGGP